jgi:hypothetical protein
LDIYYDQHHELYNDCSNNYYLADFNYCYRNTDCHHYIHAPNHHEYYGHLYNLAYSNEHYPCFANKYQHCFPDIVYHDDGYECFNLILSDSKHLIDKCILQRDYDFLTDYYDNIPSHLGYCDYIRGNVAACNHHDRNRYLCLDSSLHYRVCCIWIGDGSTGPVA